jgi:hypothetical protein
VVAEVPDLRVVDVRPELGVDPDEPPVRQPPTGRRCANKRRNAVRPSYQSWLPGSATISGEGSAAPARSAER